MNVNFLVVCTHSCLLSLAAHPAEPKKHNRQNGAEEVQQVLEATDNTQRDQVTA